MKVFAIADLHLSFSLPEKSMDVFGEEWTGYTEKIEKNWNEKISSEDLVLIAGDISWAMSMENVYLDLLWIDKLPGKKVLIKGNHDFWWSSLKKVYDALPPSISVIQNNSFTYKNVTVGGTRLWDTEEYSFKEFIEYKVNPKEKKKEVDVEEKIQKELEKKIFDRELIRLELSLKELDPHAEIRIAMTHYPPIGADLLDSKTSQILDKYNIDFCVFGHLHSLKKGISLFGKKGRVEYFLTSCDYLAFDPIRII